MTVRPVSADLLIKLAVGLAVVGAVVYAVRSVTGAIGATAEDLLQPWNNALTSAGQALSNAGAVVYETAQQAVDVTGGQSYTNAAAYTVPAGYQTDGWAGGALKPIAPTQSYQADVRRIDNAIDAGTSWTDYFRPIYFQ